MLLPLSAPIASRLEKAALDNGFDRELSTDGRWLAFASSQCPLRIWLGTTGGGAFTAAFSQQNVVLALGDLGVSMDEPLPSGAAGARVVVDIPLLHHLLRRAFQLAKSLPDELLHLFTARTARLPRTTEAERLVIQRIGQDLFRQGLLEFWEGRCAITSLAMPELLRASHIKPWADCDSDSERLDIFNGLLLAPHMDAAFDQGFMTIADAGEVILSPVLGDSARQVLGLASPLSLRVSLASHARFLAWHRAHVFKSSSPVATAGASRGIE